MGFASVWLDRCFICLSSSFFLCYYFELFSCCGFGVILRVWNLGFRGVGFGCGIWVFGVWFSGGSAGVKFGGFAFSRSDRDG